MKKYTNTIYYLFIIIFIVLIPLSDKIVLQPYSTLVYQTYSRVDVLLRPHLFHIHPLYSSNFYTPLGLRLFPVEFLFSPWFNFLSALFSAAAILFILLLFFRMMELSKVESIIFVLIVFYAVPKIIYHFVIINATTTPTPFVTYDYYNYRLFLMPLAGLGLYFLLKRKVIIAGILLGLAASIHIKFGLRYYGLLLLGGVFWTLFYSREEDNNESSLEWRHLLLMTICFVIVLLPTLREIFIAEGFLQNIAAPRLEPLISPLSWLVKNEPDDWLISYNYGFGNTTRFILLAISCLFLWKKIGKDEKDKRFLVVSKLMAIATLVSLLFFLVGHGFERYGMKWLGEKLSLSITLLRFWDLAWVVMLSFGLTAAIFFLKILKKISGVPLGNNKYQEYVGYLALAGIAAFILCSVIKIQKHGWQIFGGDYFPSGYITEISYTQVCIPETVKKYQKTWEEAFKAVKLGDQKRFGENIIKLEEIYRSVFPPGKKTGEWANPDVWNFMALTQFRRGDYYEALKSLNKIDINEKNLWKCSTHGAPVEKVTIKLPLSDYQEITRWIDNNLPRDAAIINPPYVLAFNMLSKRIGFWDVGVDQHVMYMVPNFYPLALARLYRVAGLSPIETNPGITFGEVGPEGRAHFLNLTEPEIKKIREDYPGYNYFLTECQHKLNFPLLYRNKSLALYKISD